MIRLLPRSIVLWLALCTCLAAQSRATRLRGTVQDAISKKPVSGASVSTSGDTAQRSEVTDDNGFFRILIAGVSPGDLIRLRIEKPGYAVFDQQVVATEEIPVTIALRRAGTPAPSRTGKAVGAADPIVARYIEQLKDTLISVRLNALGVLFDKAPSDAAARSAVIAAALDGDYRVRQQALIDISVLKPASKQAVTNVLIDLRDPEPRVRDQAIDALASFPNDKDAVAALLGLLGTPPSINLWPFYSLLQSGVNDPRLSEAIFYEATIGNRSALNRMEKNPLPKDLITRFLAELTKSLDSPMNFHSQGMIEVLLKSAGGHKALHDLLTSLDAYHQSRLVLSWLEVDHSAKAEILQSVPNTILAAQLNKATNVLGTETVYLNYPAFQTGATTNCNFGVQLRAAMGMLVLDLEPRMEAWKVVAYMLMKHMVASDPCRAYAAIVPGWLSPSEAKPIVPLMVKDLQCFDGGGVPAAPLDLLQDTLATIGDESTIALLQRTPEQTEAFCGDNVAAWVTDAQMAQLVARIRSRTH